MAESQRGDMGRHVDIDEVRDIRNQVLREVADKFNLLLSTVNTGFDGVHERQDLTNGRILKIENRQGGLEARTAALEREWRESVHVHRRQTDPQPTPLSVVAPVDAEEKPVRRWDVLLVCGSLAGAYGLLRFLQWLGPILQQAGKP